MSATIITILIIVFLALGVISFVWKLSKMLLIPLQIVIFVTLLWVIWRAVANRENVTALHKQVEKSALPQLTVGKVKEMTDFAPPAADTARKPAEAAPVAAAEQNSPRRPVPAVRENTPVERPQEVDEDVRPAAAVPRQTAVNTPAAPAPAPRQTAVAPADAPAPTRRQTAVTAPAAPQTPVAPSRAPAAPENRRPQKGNGAKSQSLFDQIENTHFDI